MISIKIFTFGPFQENTYLLYGPDKNCWIIDPGCYTDEEKQTLQVFISTEGLKPVKLLNTHCHLDHVFGNKFVAETYDLKPTIHEKEKELLDYAPISGLMYNAPFDHYEGEIEFIREGEILKLENVEFSVLFTPGHSPGSVSFYAKALKMLISGDVLFQRSIGRTDLPGGDMETLLTSIRNQLFVLPDETIVYSGHGQFTTIGDEKAENPFFS